MSIFECFESYVTWFASGESAWASAGYLNRETIYLNDDISAPE